MHLDSWELLKASGIGVVTFNSMPCAETVMRRRKGVNSSE